ncbi:hypothetical protein LXL04_005778 [Taraxacum kok-saghyz]
MVMVFEVVVMMFEIVVMMFDTVVTVFDTVVTVFDTVVALFDTVVALFDTVVAVFDTDTAVFDTVLQTMLEIFAVVAVAEDQMSGCIPLVAEVRIKQRRVLAVGFCRWRSLPLAFSTPFRLPAIKLVRGVAAGRLPTIPFSLSDIDNYRVAPINEDSFGHKQLLFLFVEESFGEKNLKSLFVDYRLNHIFIGNLLVDASFGKKNT